MITEKSYRNMIVDENDAVTGIVLEQTGTTSYSLVQYTKIKGTTRLMDHCICEDIDCPVYTYKELVELDQEVRRIISNWRTTLNQSPDNTRYKIRTDLFGLVFEK